VVEKAPPKSGQIRMLVLDLDGTLLRSDKTVSPRTIQALHAARDRGVEIVLNSGRMTAAMEPTAERIGIDCHLIAYNGASATGPRAQGAKRLFEKPLDLGIAMELATIARERRLQFNYYRDELVYSEDHPELRRYRDIYESRTRSPFRFVERIEDHMAVPPLKVLFVVDPAMREELYDELKPRFGKRSNMTKTDPEYLEFLHPEVDKGVGVQGLCDALHIPMSAVMAVGDGDNDGPMVACAGWGVAVSDARESVLKVAAARTEADCDHDAVAEAIERWILKA
jgi:hypothetical protein